MNSSRSLARQALVLVDERRPGAVPGPAVQLVRNQVAYVHVLRTFLRGQALTQMLGDEPPRQVEPVEQVLYRGRRPPVDTSWSEA